jgi:hypothetical protein
MNYIRVNNLTNKYPNTQSYKLQPNNKTSLFGVYTDVNIIDFNLFDFEKVIPIPGISNKGIFVISHSPSTNFIDSLNNVVETPLDINLSNRFIKGLNPAEDVKIQSSFVKQNSKNRIVNKTTNIEKNRIEVNLLNSRASRSNVVSNIDFLGGESNLQVKLFCSVSYYNDLIKSKQDGLPYFVNSSFRPEFVITINVDDLIKLKNSLTSAELEDGTLVYRHNFVKGNSIYYEALIKYIDWTLTEPTLNEIGANSVIPANLLMEYERGEFDKKRGNFNTNPDQSSNSTTTENDDYVPEPAPREEPKPKKEKKVPIIPKGDKPKPAPREEPKPKEEKKVPIIPKGDKPKPPVKPTVPDATPALEIKTPKPPVIIRYPGPVQSDTTPVVIGEQAPENPKIGESTRRSTSQPLGSANYSNPQDAIENEFRFRERKPDRER